MTQLDRAAETVRPRSPLPLILGLIAVAIGVVIVFATSRQSEIPEPAGPVALPAGADSVPGADSAPSTPDTYPAASPPSGNAIPRPDLPRDTVPAPRDAADTVRPPIGDPAALPRPRVTLPRPDSGARR